MARRINVRPKTDLEKTLQYSFTKPELLKQALTHKSAILERHPEASNRDLSPLAFVGDAVLKYTVARYLILNGKEDVVESCAKLHQGAQTVILNRFLAGIAQYKLHLEEYIIRGNAHGTPNEKMFADCMEAIFGAIALDCGTDQQEVIFRLIARLCFQPIKELLVDNVQSRLASFNREEEDKRILRDIIHRCWHDFETAQSLRERSYLQRFGQFCLWSFVIVGFLCCFVIVAIIITHSENSTNNKWYEL